MSRHIKHSLRNALLSVFILMLLLVFTNPNNMPAMLLLLLPVAAICSSYNLIKLAFLYFFYKLSLRTIRVLCIFGIIFPGVIFILGAFHQLKLLDVALSFVLAFGATLYIYTSSRMPSTREDI